MPYDPQKIILFGSRAKGTANEESDWDIAIVKDTNKPFTDRLIETQRLLDTEEAVDVFVFTPKEFEQYKFTNPTVKEISDTGKLIYEQ